MIQLTMSQKPIGETIYLTLHDFVPAEELESPEPSDALVQSIYENWVLVPLIVCLTDSGKYYPLAGKRRVKAVNKLATYGLLYQGVSVQDVPISAIYRSELGPTDNAIEFTENNLRSPNAISDVAVILKTAEELGADLNTHEGQREIARALSTTANVIKRISSNAVSNVVIRKAYIDGRLSTGAVKAVSKLRSKKDIQDIIGRLDDDERLTENDVLAYNKALSQETLRHMGATPTFSELQPGAGLNEAIQLLEEALLSGDLAKVEAALSILRSLL